MKRIHHNLVLTSFLLVYPFLLISTSVENTDGYETAYPESTTVQEQKSPHATSKQQIQMYPYKDRAHNVSNREETETTTNCLNGDIRNLTMISSTATISGEDDSEKPVCPNNATTVLPSRYTTTNPGFQRLPALVGEHNQTVEIESFANDNSPKVISAAKKLLRWCHFGKPEQDSLCSDMALELKKASLLDITCIRARNVFECIRNIHNNIADATRLTAEQIYVAGKYFGLLPVVRETWPLSGEFTEDTVVVVRKDPTKPRDEYDNGLRALKGKKLCLTGSGDQNIQYQSLINVLFPLGIMEVYDSECTDPLASLNHYFGPSCVPGKWALDVDLHRKYSNLCQGCFTNCLSNDFFAGPEGALRCLVDGNGDVAVTTSQALAKAQLDSDFYQLLCIQGTKKPINSTCVWMGRRTPAIVVSPKLAKSVRETWRNGFMQLFVKYQGLVDNWTTFWSKNVTNANNRAVANARPKSAKNISRVERPEWLSHLLFSRSDLAGVEDVYYRSTSERYVGEIFVRSMETPFPYLDCGRPTRFKWCVTTDQDQAKCTEIGMALETQRLRPALTCVKARTSEECQRLVAGGSADITVLRADKVMAAHIDDKLVPVAMEKFPDNKATNYLLAIVKKNSNITLSKLSGARSCHPSAEDVLGWHAPLTILERLGLTEIINCDYPRAASTIFWESCVPEIAKYSNQADLFTRRVNDISLHESLCRMCGGIENCDYTSPFRDYDGAIKCLQNSKGIAGDIAFVTDESIQTGKMGVLRGLLDNLELLCTDGQVRPLTDAKDCNWLSVPGRLLVVSASKYPRQSDRKQITDFLMEIQDRFGRAPDITKIVSDLNDPDFNGYVNLFANKEDPNAIFSKETEQLWPIYPQEQLDDILGKEFAEVYRRLKHCTSCSCSFKVSMLMLCLNVAILLLAQHLQ